LGVALATALSAFVNAGLLFRGLREEGVYRPRPGWRGLFARGLLANAAMAAVLVWLAGDLAVWIGQGAGARIADLATCIGAGVLVYGTVLMLSGLRMKHLKAD
jgi:putative peptidoglycan lipid II flippase